MKNYLQTSFLIMACALPLFPYPVGSVVAAESAVARQNIEKLVTTKSCKGCDLSGVTLNRLDLVDADLEGADLSSAKLSLTNLTRANLRNTNLRGAVFGGTDLSDADLRGADLRGTSLDSSYRQGAQFDGEFIAEKPTADVGEVGGEKEVFIADSVKPKQNPATKDANIIEQRVVEAPPSTLPVVREVRSEVKSEVAPLKPQEVPKDRQSPASGTLAPAPIAKRVALVQEAIVDVSATDEKKLTSSALSDLPAKTDKVEVKKESAAEPVVTAPVKKNDVESDTVKTIVKSPVEAQVETDKDKKQPPPATVTKETKASKVAEVKPIVEGGAGVTSRKPSAVKTKEENLARLVDKNKCYGCDLSALDLAGKNLKSADLEKADLSGCNLERADLDTANLKGALLKKANLRQASLENADFYKADLTGADLTGAKVKGAFFDSAQTASAVGLVEAIGAAAK